MKNHRINGKEVPRMKNKKLRIALWIGVSVVVLAVLVYLGLGQ